jgi:hypothetical protein
MSLAKGGISLALAIPFCEGEVYRVAPLNAEGI